MLVRKQGDIVLKHSRATIGRARVLFDAAANECELSRMITQDFLILLTTATSAA
jgi:hypothetical protein